MEEISTEEIRRTFQTFVDITLCAVCLETVRPNMVQCVNGHLFCSECKDEQNLDVCPTCRDNFSDVKPSGFVSQIVEALPPRCKHKNCGRYVKGGDGHEKYCGFMPSECKVEGCNWKGTRATVPQHVRETHADNLTVSETDSIHMNIVLDHFDPHEDRSFFKPMIIKNNFFWIQICNCHDKKILTISFHLVPVEKPKSDMYAKISCVNDIKFLMKFKLNLDPDVSDENYVPIPQFMLTSLVKENDFSIDVSVKIK